MRTLRPSQPSKVRVVAFVAVAALFALFVSANGMAGIYTDWLWYDNMEFGQIWSTVISTQIVLGAAFSLIFFAIVWGNLYLADRLKPPFRPESPEEDLVERYHALVGPQAGKVRIGIAVLFGLIAGANTSAQWRTWLLFRSGGDFDWADPMFGRDAGFYVFRLPFWTFLVDWFFAALILTLIVVAVAHYLNGGIRAATSGERVTTAAKIHLSVVLAVLALLRAAAYWLDRFHLLTSTRGAYDGALATDVNILQPALNLLTIISLFCAALFLANVRRPGWGLPTVAIGIWAISHFAIAGILPLAYQRIRIEPEESRREAPFVANNIAATRFAYGLDDSRVTQVQFDYQAGLDDSDVEAYADVLANVPVVDPVLAVEEVTRTEAERQLYSFSNVLDVDRYTIDGQTRPVVLSVRELNSSQVQDSWERQHVIFTHGHGLAMAAAFDSGPVVGESRALDFLVSGLGDSRIDDGLELSLDQPRIYYGENFGGYAIVDGARDEVDYQTADNQTVPYRYTGEGGVPMGSLLRRLAFSLRFREPDPLISGTVTGDSRVIYNRGIEERVQSLAPFLRFDSNPYPVVVDGGVKWVLDAYTTTDDFPYSQSVDTGVSGSLQGGLNYVRNSVKAVVDAYDGEVTMYIVDDTDPIVRAWSQVFPDLFTSGADVPESLRQHLRYPEDIFTVQTDMWESYVVGDAGEFIEGALAWSVAGQPPIEAEEQETAAAPAGSMRPQYLMARVPGGEGSEFVLQRAFVPRGGSAGSSSARPELTGIMMARSDPENYGQLVLLRLPAGEVFAPDRVHSEIRKSQDMTVFIREKAGARVEFGEMSVVVLDDTIVYVRPVYVEANSVTAVPELQRVVAVNGNRISMGNSIEEAVSGVLGATASVSFGDGDGEDGGGASTVDFDPTGIPVVELIEIAEDNLLAADEAEANGQVESALELRQRAALALAEARRLLGGAEPPVAVTADDAPAGDDDTGEGGTEPPDETASADS